MISKSTKTLALLVLMLSCLTNLYAGTISETIPTTSQEYETDLKFNGHTLREFNWKLFDSQDFLNYLRMIKKEQPHDHVTIAVGPDKHWLKNEDLAALGLLVDSTEECAHVVSIYSSLFPRGSSNIGQEVSFLIEGIRKGKYPPSLNSSDVDVDEIKEWLDDQ